MATAVRRAAGAGRAGPGSPPWTCPRSPGKSSRTPWRSSTPWNRSPAGPGAEIRGHARSDPRVNVLTQLPGVGPFTALVLLAEIGDITRFASARKLASWAGLTPTVRGSDRTVRHGHISRQGSVWVRWILCEAAQKAKRHPDFAASYQAIAGRRGTKIATTAIARKLLTRACHLLTDAASAGAPR